MKKKSSVCLLLLCLFMSTGCENKEKNVASIEQKSDFQFGLSIANTEEGSYLLANKTIDSDNYRIVYFFDKQSEKLVALCQKVNCEHKDMTCLALQLGVIEKNDQIYKLFSTIFYNERLYLSYIGLTGNTSVLVESVAKDGSDLKKEYESSDLGMLNVFSMYKDKFIISKGFFEKNEAGNIIGSSTINAIVMYDPNTKKETVIANKENKIDRMVYPIGMEEETLYYTDIDMALNTNKISSYNIGDSNSAMILNDTGLATTSYDGYVYYLKDNVKIIKQSMKSEENETFLELDKKPLKISVYPQGYLTYDIQNDEGVFFTQIIDLNTSENLFEELEQDIDVLGRNENYYFVQNSKDEIIKIDPENGKKTVLN